MKANTKKKGSPAKKLIPAAGSLMVSAVMLATSTYAWFTMNKHVEVTGMEMKTKVGTNLLICSDNVETNYSSAILVEGRKALLEPVSSINGTTGSFWYTVNATARGTKESDATITQYNETQEVANTVAGKFAYDKAFNGTYGVKDTSTLFTTENIGMTNSENGAAYGYVDYVFYLKGTSDTANQQLRMTECDILYNGENITSATSTVGTDVDRAWRVGVFVQQLNAATQGGKGNSGEAAAVGQIDPASTASNQKAILGLANSTYFTNGQAQASASALGNVVNFKNGAANTEGVVLDTFENAGTTAYYKVLVRVWLDGEDDTCNSATYAALQSGKWSLSCKFDLDNSVDAITGLNTIKTNFVDTTDKTTQAAVTSPIDVAKTPANNG